MPRRTTKTAIRNSRRFIDPEAHLRRQARRGPDALRAALGVGRKPLRDQTREETRLADFEDSLLSERIEMRDPEFRAAVAQWRANAVWPHKWLTELWDSFDDIPAARRIAAVAKVDSLEVGRKHRT